MNPEGCPDPSGPLLRPKIKQDIAKTPDQPPPAFKGVLNPPESIWEVARTIGELKSLDPLEILDITTENFKRLFTHGMAPETYGNP